MIVMRAEEDIKLMTGKKMRLLIVPSLEMNPALDVVTLTRVVASALDMLPSDCHNRLKTAPYVHLRVLTAHFIRQYFPNVPLKKVGEMVGGYDHTTVIHYTKVMFPELFDKRDPDFMPKYDAAIQAVTQWDANNEEA